MCLKSEEGNMEGLGIFNAEVKSFSKNISEFLKVPHMGWNFLERNKKSKYLNNLKTLDFILFIRSMHRVMMKVKLFSKLNMDYSLYLL